MRHCRLSSSLAGSVSAVPAVPTVLNRNTSTCLAPAAYAFSTTCCPSRPPELTQLSRQRLQSSTSPPSKPDRRRLLKQEFLAQFFPPASSAPLNRSAAVSRAGPTAKEAPITATPPTKLDWAFLDLYLLESAGNNSLQRPIHQLNQSSRFKEALLLVENRLADVVHTDTRSESVLSENVKRLPLRNQPVGFRLRSLRSHPSAPSIKEQDVKEFFLALRYLFLCAPGHECMRESLPSHIPNYPTIKRLSQRLVRTVSSTPLPPSASLPHPFYQMLKRSAQTTPKQQHPTVARHPPQSDQSSTQAESIDYCVQKHAHSSPDRLRPRGPPIERLRSTKGLVPRPSAPTKKAEVEPRPSTPTKKAKVEPRPSAPTKKAKVDRIDKQFRKRQTKLPRSSNRKAKAPDRASTMAPLYQAFNKSKSPHRSPLLENLNSSPPLPTQSAQLGKKKNIVYKGHSAPAPSR